MYPSVIIQKGYPLCKKQYVKGYRVGPQGETLPRYKAWLTEHPLPVATLYKAGDSLIF